MCKMIMAQKVARRLKFRPGRKKCGKVVNLFIEELLDLIIQRRKVTLYQFGTFKLMHRKARKVWHPAKKLFIDRPDIFEMKLLPSPKMKELMRLRMISHLEEQAQKNG